MWRCTFDAVTLRGTGCFREPMEGEIVREIHPSACGWFNVHPERYVWDGSGLAAWPGWAEDEDAARLAGERAVMVCGPLQIRKALRAAGLYQTVSDYIETADEEVKEGWEYASEFKRLDPFVLGVQTALGKTDVEVDAIFSLALTL